MLTVRSGVSMRKRPPVGLLRFRAALCRVKALRLGLPAAAERLRLRLLVPLTVVASAAEVRRAVLSERDSPVISPVRLMPAAALMVSGVVVLRLLMERLPA